MSKTGQALTFPKQHGKMLKTQSHFKGNSFDERESGAVSTNMPGSTTASYINDPRKKYFKCKHNSMHDSQRSKPLLSLALPGVVQMREPCARLKKIEIKKEFMRIRSVQPTPSLKASKLQKAFQENAQLSHRIKSQRQKNLSLKK